jgi:hypothetical protein
MKPHYLRQPKGFIHYACLHNHRTICLKSGLMDLHCLPFTPIMIQRRVVELVSFNMVEDAIAHMKVENASLLPPQFAFISSPRG